jgi:acetyltransferase
MILTELSILATGVLENIMTLDNFFTPNGVVIVGASNNPAKLGHRLAANLVESGYGGAIHFVNPRGGKLLGRTIYSGLDEVPDPVDLAALLVPAEQMPATLAACGQRGIRSAIILSGGFRETGPQGAALETECLRVAREYGIRLLGPNCVGIIDTHTPLDTTFLPPPIPVSGEVALISHSGAMIDVLIDWARSQGLGLSRMVSLGNQADLNEADFLPVLAADANTGVILLYLEGIKDGARFLAEASRAALQKPVVALKVGRSASGQRAAASHTGALAGQDHAFEAAFRRAGVLRANSDQELIDWVKALAWSPLPAGRKVAVLTNAGGPGVIASDALEAHGLQLAELSAATRAALAATLPPAASLNNPVDMLGTATPEQYAACLRPLLADPQVESVLLILPPPPVGNPAAFAEAVCSLLHVEKHKPVLVALMGGGILAEAASRFQAAHIPSYPFAEQAVSALAALVRQAEIACRRAEIVHSGPTPPSPLPNVQPEAVRMLLSGQPFDAAAVLAAYGIPVPRAEIATSPEAAAAVAAQISGPVAMKIVSPDILHKSDVGGVLLGLEEPEAVRQGYQTILDNARSALPEAKIEGVLVQQMIPAGQEVIAGMVRDPQFGPLLMFGSGGVEVEGLGDITFELAPLGRGEAEAMLERTWAGRKLRGFRNLPAADREAVIDVLLRLSQLALDFPEIDEIEINPLRVLPSSHGAFAVDGRGQRRGNS